MSIEENKAIVRRLHDLWNKGDLALIPEVFHPDFAGHWPPSSRKPERRGLDEVRAGIISTRTAFPDWFEDVVDMVRGGRSRRHALRLHGHPPRRVLEIGRASCRER